jgi:hypothetical protein
VAYGILVPERDLAAQGYIDVVLCYSPDRVARKFAYQALLTEELARCGTPRDMRTPPVRSTQHAGHSHAPLKLRCDVPRRRRVTNSDGLRVHVVTCRMHINTLTR